MACARRRLGVEQRHRQGDDREEGDDTDARKHKVNLRRGHALLGQPREPHDSNRGKQRPAWAQQPHGDGRQEGRAKHEKGNAPDGHRAELPDLSEVEDHARDEETEQLHPHRKGEGYKHYVNEALWPEGCLHYANPFCSGD